MAPSPALAAKATAGTAPIRAKPPKSVGTRMIVQLAPATAQQVALSATTVAPTGLRGKSLPTATALLVQSARRMVTATKVRLVQSAPRMATVRPVLPTVTVPTA
jgi:hypothetical protein